MTFPAMQGSCALRHSITRCRKADPAFLEKRESLLTRNTKPPLETSGDEMTVPFNAACAAPDKNGRARKYSACWPPTDHPAAAAPARKKATHRACGRAHSRPAHTDKKIAEGKTISYNIKDKCTGRST